MSINTINKKIKNILVTVCLFIFCFLINCLATFANNFSVSNVSLENRNPLTNTVIVEFDVSWENSWKTKINHDAAWVTVRFYDANVTPTNKTLCQVSANGLNPTGTSIDATSNLEIYVSSDKYGFFIRPSAYGINSTVSATDVQLTFDYEACGFNDDANVFASVSGIEMVYIPEAAFYAGDQDSSTATLDEGSADSDPWYLASSAAISVTNPASNGYRYVSSGHAGEDATGASFTISASFPKGYQAFYAMKYEITEGQWVEFLNSLPSAASRANRDLTDSFHKNSDLVKFRNTISCSGSPLVCSTQRPARALNYVSWMDLAAFLDWSALRPMTELEYEKMSRGPILPVASEFTWGSTDITAATALSAGDEDGTETVANAGANVHYNNIILTGGDVSAGADHAQGPLRGGIFATGASSRIAAGGGYYGVMDLAGNVRERVVTIGNASGRNFSGTHGDGILSTETSYEGNANVSNWPGMDANVNRGITGADGSGFRGGAWDDELSGARLRISDRFDAANTATAAFSNAGGRGVRIYDGN